jgi:hypothetical protein
MNNVPLHPAFDADLRTVAEASGYAVWPTIEACEIVAGEAQARRHLREVIAEIKLMAAEIADIQKGGIGTWLNVSRWLRWRRRCMTR